MSEASNPIRFPNTGNRRIMTNRGWWLLVANVLVPGSAQLLAGNRRLGRIGITATAIAWFVVILGLILNAAWPVAAFTIATTPFVMFLAQVGLICYAILWVVLTFDTLRLIRLVKTGPRARFWLPAVALVLVAVFSGTSVWASSLVGGAQGLLTKVGVAAPAVEPVDGRYNFVVMGTDSDTQRDSTNEGQRPDSLQVISVDASTGAAVSLGFPRDLHNIVFPASSPLAAAYPNGYTESDADYCTEWACLNTIFVDAEEKHADLYPQAKKLGVSPGVLAMMDAAEGITGLKMQFYVVVNMDGVVNLIDAVGGVTINVDERVALANYGTPEDEVPAWIESGVQHLDGWHALMYARSRWAPTGDYDRMGRQQKLLAALQQQMNPVNVLSKFQQISAAGGHMVSTNIPQPMFGTLVDLALKSRKAGFTGVAFTPFSSGSAQIDPHDPDYTRIQAYIHELVYPPVASESPTPTP